MPQYQFRCDECASYFLMQMEFTDNSIPDCINCEKPMRKVYHATPAIFRGDGWTGKK